MKERASKTTADGSSTIYLPAWNEHYHSSHGALQEAQHVFIEHGLKKIGTPKIKIIEYGFGTGLNALLSVFYSEEKNMGIDYIALEKYPLNFEELEKLNFANILKDKEDYFGKMHRSPWGDYMPVSKNFRLKKIQQDFRNFSFEENVDLVYYDAFGYRVQPHLWEKEIFSNICNHLNSGGLLTTYSSKGIVRRMLEDIGFEVEKIAGPKGKREMINAWKR